MDNVYNADQNRSKSHVLDAEIFAHEAEARSIDFDDCAPSFISKTLPDLLDRAVSAGQNIYVLGHHVHPWLMLQDIGFIAIFLLVLAFTRLFEGVVFYKFVLLFGLIYLGYEKVYPRIKLLIFHTKLRSYLQDSIVYFFPAFLIGSWAMGMPITVSADLLGLIFPLLFGFVRLACFLGGCCYGVPWKNGIQYPDNMMAACGHRRYTQTQIPAVECFQYS